MFLYVKRQKIEIREAKKAKPLNLCKTIDISTDTTKIHINIDTDMNIKRNNKSISYINISMQVTTNVYPPPPYKGFQLFLLFSPPCFHFLLFNCENIAFFAVSAFFAFF